MNRSIGDIKIFIGSLTTYLHSLGKNLKDFIISPPIASQSILISCPVSWGCRIHQLLLYRGGKTSTTSVLIMTLNNMMVRFQ